jgi:hypothetical protein
MNIMRWFRGTSFGRLAGVADTQGAAVTTAVPYQVVEQFVTELAPSTTPVAAPSSPLIPADITQRLISLHVHGSRSAVSGGLPELTPADSLAGVGPAAMLLGSGGASRLHAHVGREGRPLGVEGGVASFS